MHLQRLLPTCVAAIVVALAVPAGAGATGGVVATTADVLDVATYRVNTTYRAPDGELVTRTTPGVVGVPALVNVERPLLSAPDLAVSITPLPIGRISMSASRLFTAPALMPVSVEVVIDLPGAGDPRIGFGYDALASTAPGRFTGSVAFTLGAKTEIDLDVDVRQAPPTVGITGELFKEGPYGERRDPRRGRVDFTPVPESSSFTVTLEDRPEEDLIDVHTETGQVLDAVVSGLSRTGAAEQRLDATIRGLPPVMDIGLDLPADKVNGPLAVDYTGSVPAGRIDARGTARTAGAIDTDVLAQVDGLPTELHVLRDRKDHATLTTDRPIQAAQVALGNGTAAAFPAEGRVPEGFDQWFVADDEDEPEDDVDGLSTMAARVTGLSELELDGGSPLLIDTVHTAGPFFADVRRGTEPITARVLDLPGDVRLSFAKPDETADGFVDYTADAEIGRIVVDAQDPDGFSEKAPRATDLDLTVDRLPARLRLDFSGEGERFALDAGEGQRIGEAVLTAGDGSTLGAAPEDQLGANDGVIFRDRPEQFIVHGRIRDLERAVVIQEGDAIHLEADTAGARPLLADSRTREAGDEEEKVGRLTLDALPASIDADVLLPDPEAEVGFGSIRYDGSAALGRLTLFAIDPEGVIKDRPEATHVDATIEELPAGTTLQILTIGENQLVQFDAGGNRVGLVEADVSDGQPAPPGETLDPAHDGALIRDLDDRFRVFARVTGLRGLSLLSTERLRPDRGFGPETERVIGIDARTDGGRVLRVDLARDTELKRETLVATFDDLPGHLTVDQVDRTGVVTGERCEEVFDNLPKDEREELCAGDAVVPIETVLTYDGHGETAESVVVDTNMGERHSLHAAVGDPQEGILVPARVHVCQSLRNICPEGSREGDMGSMQVQASSRTVLNLLDCVVPLGPEGCDTDLPVEMEPFDPRRRQAMTFVENLSLRELTFNGDDPRGGGHVYLDTANTELTGLVDMIDKRGKRTRLFLPDGFRADGRFVSLGIGLFIVERKEPIGGRITCPGNIVNTFVDLRVDTLLGQNGNLANEICNGPQREPVGPEGLD